MNGNYSVAGRPSEYKVCRDGRTIDIRRCERGGVYDEAAGGCKLVFDFSKYGTIMSMLCCYVSHVVL